MAKRPSAWLPWLLYRLTLGTAAALLALLLLAPLAPGGSRVLALFAHDAALRRTSAASAVGLVATAYIFFRPPAGSRFSAPRSSRRQPPSAVGA
jgi:hypothetical protein